MNVTSVSITLNSEDPQRLYNFYRHVVGLPVLEGREEALHVAGLTLNFDTHSGVNGAVEEPARALFDLFVDDVAAEEARIAAKGVPVVRSQGREYWGGIISTFADPDGRYFQLIEYRPGAAE